MNASGLLPCNLIPKPISPAANPCCNWKARSRSLSLGEGNAATRFHFAHWQGCGSMATYARAQEAAKLLIGVLSGGAPDDPNISAFLQGLKEGGYVESQSVAIEYRFANGQYDRCPDRLCAGWRPRRRWLRRESRASRWQCHRV